MHIRKQSEEYLQKKDRLIYLRRYAILIQARLKMKYRIASDKV
jgi:hypothetical protein